MTHDPHVVLFLTSRWLLYIIYKSICLYIIYIIYNICDDRMMSSDLCVACQVFGLGRGGSNAGHGFWASDSPLGGSKPRWSCGDGGVNSREAGGAFEWKTCLCMCLHVFAMRNSILYMFWWYVMLHHRFSPRDPLFVARCGSLPAP